MLLKKSAHSRIDISLTSGNDLPATNTWQYSFLSLVPWHSGQGSGRINFEIYMRTYSDSVSLNLLSKLCITPSKGSKLERDFLPPAYTISIGIASLPVPYKMICLSFSDNCSKGFSRSILKWLDTACSNLKKNGFCLSQPIIAPCARDFFLSTTTLSSSKIIIDPRPSHFGQDPWGLLKEKSLGSNSGIE